MVRRIEDDIAAPSPRRKLLDAALELFYRDGMRAVGVDTVVAKAGVAKMSLYRAFPSKDDLIAAVLEDANHRYWQWWDKVMDRHPGQPSRQLVGLFASVAKWTTGPGYRGCPFINTAVEFPDPQHPGRRVVLAHKAEQHRRLAELCRQAGAPQPDSLANQLLLLLEGAYSAGNTMGPDGPAGAAASAAEALIEAALH
ncbi:MAG: TetR/AcrR family transcriptional regulator [Rhodospirillales bacterium]|nr:TetR/AcrR family transcriptional regulator [Rhodospirillales bacterium]